MPSPVTPQASGLGLGFANQVFVELPLAYKHVRCGTVLASTRASHCDRDQVSSYVEQRGETNCVSIRDVSRRLATDLRLGGYSVGVVRIALAHETDGSARARQPRTNGDPRDRPCATWD